ncbi:MAG: outer membrane beta-barrel protein [Bacteroidales bacterium]|nr:outer membrane beta-barrel protein [Bacteroidales bacterium]
MDKREEISRGGLSDKMSSFRPEPPGSVWDSVTERIHPGREKRRLLFLLSAAAGIALAVTVGISLLFNLPEEDIAIVEEYGDEQHVLPDDEPARAGEEENLSFEKDKKIEKSTQSTDWQQVHGAPGKFKKKVREDVKQMVQSTTIAQAEMERIDRDKTDTAVAGDTIMVYAADPPDLPVNEDSLLSLLHADTLAPILAIADNGKSRWEIGASFSPLYSYRDAASPDAALNSIVDNSESARITYSGGVKVSFLQSERFTVESGLYYNKMGVNIGDFSSKNTWETPLEDALADAENTVAVSNSMGTIVSEDNDLSFIANYGSGIRTDGDYLSTGEILINSTLVSGLAQSFDYLEVPFRIKYLVIDRSLKVQLMGGISANFLVNSSTLLNTEEGRIDIGEVMNVRTLNYSGTAGMGFIYDLARNISLSVEPRFRYYLNSINTAQLPVTRPYAFGLYTGVNYTF